MTVKGLIGKSTLKPADYLWFDYNCLVYHVLKSMPSYSAHEKESWEDTLIKNTCNYTQKVAGSIPRVFVGLDGVVPMAKIKQQRLRRWKSIWTTEEERRLGKIGVEEVWDRNAITPGTNFMEKLGGRLGQLSQSKTNWTCSPVSEPGEGEHKIMERLRGLKETEPHTHVIYGLDADLILLALYNSRYLHPDSSIYLMREEEDDSTSSENNVTFSYLNVKLLRDSLVRKLRRSCETETETLTDYIFAMTLLGNDFVPHGISFTLKNNGYSILTQMLREKDRPRLINADNTWSSAGLAYVFSYIAALEEGLIAEGIQNKRDSAYHKVLHGEDAHKSWARDYSDWMKTPAKHMDEYALVEHVYSDSVKMKHGQSWISTYYKAWFGTIHYRSLCNSYIEGLHWVLRYYTGQSVNHFWYYPWNLPPLFCTLAAHYSELVIDDGSISKSEHQSLTMVEQCAMALPAPSMHLVSDMRYHGIVRALPHYFPRECRLFHVGSSQLWASVPQLPILTAERLRELVG